MSPAASGLSVSNSFAPAVDHKFIKYNATSFDYGTCGGPWANDTFEIQYTVHNNGDGTYWMRAEYKGTFVTLAGNSPGACQVSTPHGSTLVAGIKGHFKGVLDQTVTGAYDPSKACARDKGTSVGDCATPSGFLSRVFGPSCGGPLYGCSSNVTFNLEYRSGDPRLSYDYWRDSLADPTEGFGDIAM